MKQTFMKGLVTATFAVAFGCGAPHADNSAVKITNGKTLTDADYPSVVLLYDASAGALCSGTFINSTTVISAAHCTESGKVASDGTVSGASLSIIKVQNLAAGQASLVATATKLVRNPLWDKNGKNVNKYDLSLITFPEGTAEAVSQIATVEPSAGDKLTIVGYGLNQSTNLQDGSSAAVKRIGTNTIKDVSEGFIEFTGANKTTSADGTNASASAGDSGGPLFVNGKVAGVTSGGGAGGIFSSSSESLYIDLNSPESQAFLKAHLGTIASGDSSSDNNGSVDNGSNGSSSNNGSNDSDCSWPFCS